MQNAGKGKRRKHVAVLKIRCGDSCLWDVWATVTMQGVSHMRMVFLKGHLEDALAQALADVHVKELWMGNHKGAACVCARLFTKRQRHLQL